MPVISFTYLDKYMCMEAGLQNIIEYVGSILQEDQTGSEPTNPQIKN
jgi:hypothetical protein